MKIYKPGYSGTLTVTPGTEVDTSEFKDEMGNAKILRVKFVNGVAKVSPNLGRWMIDKGYARNRRLLF